MPRKNLPARSTSSTAPTCFCDPRSSSMPRTGDALPLRRIVLIAYACVCRCHGPTNCFENLLQAGCFVGARFSASPHRRFVLVGAQHPCPRLSPGGCQVATYRSFPLTPSHFQATLINR